MREPAGVSVIVTLGAREAALVPTCGCDACDPDVEQLALALEAVVMALVGAEISADAWEAAQSVGVVSEWLWEERESWAVWERR